MKKLFGIEGFALLQIILLALKVTNTMDISWYVVLFPIIYSFLIIISITLLYIFALIFNIIKEILK